MHEHKEPEQDQTQDPLVDALRIHINLTRTHYAFSKEQLALLKQASHSLWQSLFLVCASISLPTLCNALIEYSQLRVASPTPQFTAELFLNALLGLTTLCLSIAFGFVWRHAARTKHDVIAAVKAHDYITVAPPTGPPHGNVILPTTYPDDEERETTQETEYH